jgi:glycosyltransferase involved in cell wall biosynthesis
MPRVSIVTPLFNKGTYVAATIASVQGQTLEDWELLVVENGSSDEGPGLVRTAALADARVRLLEAPKPGPGAKRNFGVAQAHGDWILFLDADDLLEPDYLAERVRAAGAAGPADVVVGGWREFDVAAPQTQVARLPAAFRQSQTALEQNAIAFCPWAVHAALVRRERFSASRSWNEALDGLASEDTAFWFPMIHGARIAWSDGNGALYRVNLAAGRNRHTDRSLWLRSMTAVIESNVAWLRARGEQPTPAQCAMIMRVFESEYRRCLAQGAREFAGQALAHANQWLARCPSLAPGILARKVLGIAAVVRWRGSLRPSPA